MDIDVSAWVVIRDEPGGRDKNKRWLAEDPDAPRDQHWLWKHRQSTGDGSGVALTDCAEVFTSRLAAAIELPAADCRFAILDGEPGVISRNVTPKGFNLNTGMTYLSEIEGYQRRTAGSSAGGGRMRLDEGYTLDSMQQILEHVEAPPGTGEPSGSLCSPDTSCSMPWSGTAIGIRETGPSWSDRAMGCASSRRPTTMAARWVPA